MTVSAEKITCQKCGALAHSIKIHLRDDHPDMTIEQYQEAYPAAPLLSPLAMQKVEEMKRKRAAEAAAAPAAEGVTVEHAASAKVVDMVLPDTVIRVALHEAFSLGKAKAALSAAGDPIMVRAVQNPRNADYVPEKDPGYVFDIPTLKDVLLGMDLPTPVYVWGHKGTGKTTLLEQICACLNWPMLRVQHTVNMEESHVLGQWTAKDGSTVWEDGPLVQAMKNGWVYLADEYDFALANVLAVYQPVLEGKPLVIKEAPAESRIVRPHPNFRFFATGNTNGAGDESGLYQGTNIQNSANYDRFGVVMQVMYMPAPQEQQILINQARLHKDDAQKIVQFANLVREAFDGSQISETVSTRTLITAGRLGLRKSDWRAGLRLSFINKLTKLDREVVDSIAQRIFG